ncbi:MAG: PorT family protein [Bacteroidales bacterium]|nr:PorT family protein [Bacteroidales bacterium]
MKKTILMMIAIAFGVTAMAQFTYGPKLGLNLANQSGDDVDNNSMLIGFNLGAFGNYAINDMFSIQLEALYDTKGANYEYTVNNETEKYPASLGYLSFPIFAKAAFGSGDTKFFGEIGPQIGLLMSAKYDGDSEIKIGNETYKYKDNYKSTDFGLGIGAGALIPAGGMTLMIDARYTMGLSSIGEEQDVFTGIDPVTFQPMYEKQTPDIKNAVIGIGVGLIFGGE